MVTGTVIRAQRSSSVPRTVPPSSSTDGTPGGGSWPLSGAIQAAAAAAAGKTSSRSFMDDPPRAFIAGARSEQKRPLRKGRALRLKLWLDQIHRPLPEPFDGRGVDGGSRDED